MKLSSARRLFWFCSNQNYPSENGWENVWELPAIWEQQRRLTEMVERDFAVWHEFTEIWLPLGESSSSFSAPQPNINTEIIQLVIPLLHSFNWLRHDLNPWKFRFYFCIRVSSVLNFNHHHHHHRRFQREKYILLSKRFTHTRFHRFVFFSINTSEANQWNEQKNRNEFHRN